MQLGPALDVGVQRMWIDRNNGFLTVHAPAKVNLFFEVLAKRTDGYHEIVTLMGPVNCCDTISIVEDRSGRISLSVSAASGPRTPDRAWIADVPRGPENLVVRALELLRRRAGESRGASVRLVKRIPSAAGLGGGSSDAAATLLAANLLWRLGLSRSELAELASQLGSDVPFFLAGGPAVCRGRGQRVEPVAAGTILHLVVVRPPEGLSTAAVYRACRPAEQPEPIEPVLEAWAKGETAELGRRLHNRLQPAAESLSPWIGRLRSEMARLDCLGHQMSGSGTSYFGLCRHARHAARVANRLRARSLGTVFVLRTCRW